MYYKYDKYYEHVGILFIRPNKNDILQFDLFLGDKLINSYSTAEEAANAVAAQKTGETAWDRLTEPAGPLGLGEWTKIS